ncbi:MAG: hypothetical protein LBP68_04150 [Acidobacteriota bacterium]|jgi:hypothetical protein|nr:hypothetical protein [Acidobacteriota bacterium]
MPEAEGLKPGKKKESCPSAKADGNTCKEFLFPLCQLKLPFLQGYGDHIVPAMPRKV